MKAAFGLPIVLVLLLALALRLPGVFYGLPLTSLVGDEPSMILGALKMLELHTLVPALHSQEFATLLYYPPYLSYLFLPFFAAILGVEYFLWGGSHALFASYALSDLSPFFIAARLCVAASSLASVWLVYRVAQALWRSERAALASAFLFATSLLDVGLSAVVRHWVPAAVFFLL
ncbi:MAG TPA: hypothetical protein VHD37_01030, partial [Candidatus Paceibacterota bacterium]|nr:hypothetical protein [Candidatus Paceibacterota bacterium]